MWDRGRIREGLRLRRAHRHHFDTGAHRASAGVGRQVTLSPQEEVTQAESYVSRMEATRGSAVGAGAMLWLPRPS